MKDENAILIWFPPYKKELEIDVLIYTENIESETDEIIIEPSDTQKWIIYKDKNTEPVQFKITGQSDCQFDIYTELFETEQGWWKRIQSISTKN